MKKLTYLLLCLVLGIGLATAQTRKVTGTVISAEDSEPIIGASVIVKGTTTGTVTDFDGAFSLDVPSSAKTLVISYVGMIAREVPVQDVLRVVLQSGTQNLEEVVVTAIGMKKQEKALGYAASTVKSEDLNAAKSGSVMSGLTGKVAGLNITSGGATGSSQKVIVRGISSFSANQPLYVVDGVPIMNDFQGEDSFSNSVDFGNQANDINPEDVESVTVLKGASATALYGSRAANGVIMVTTKLGLRSFLLRTMAHLWDLAYCVFLKHKIVSDKDGDLSDLWRMVLGDRFWMVVIISGDLTQTAQKVY